ncbi:nuclear body protein SP140-like protein [Silurus meridionalis]|nr:nuclear body protein SP140-like protein [Silurus meridionalis]
MIDLVLFDIIIQVLMFTAGGIDGGEMDPLDFITNEELMKFFHCKKTEISCTEEPHTFLKQLRDHNLVPEKLYQKVIRMKCKDRRQEGVYQILDWLEKERGHCVKRFWTCVFKNHILQKYQVFRSLHNSLLDGSFRCYTALFAAEELSSSEQDSIQSMEDKANGQTNGKRKKSTEKAEEKDEPGPSSLSKCIQKKPAKRLSFNAPLKQGHKADFYKSQLPVTCGEKEGTLYREKLAKGYKNICCDGRWFSASEFEKFAGQGNGRNWKRSIYCQNTPLHKLIEDGYLQFLRPHDQKVLNTFLLVSVFFTVNQKIQLPVSSLEAPSPLLLHRCLLESASSAGTEGSWNEADKEGDEEEDGQPVDLSKFQGYALPVSCGSVSGVLYESRFRGSRSKSIRTEERWFSPEEFVKQEIVLTDGHWERDILCHGKTLNYLMKKKILTAHPSECHCFRCSPANLQEQDNDDVCFICNSAGIMVCCDECPRSFHLLCHLPVLDEETLGKNWMCTFCVLKTNQQLWIHMTSEGVLNSPVSGNVMHCEYLLLCLYREDALRVFTADPTKTVPRYTRVISKPMWLDQVKTKLQKNSYQIMRDFVEDIRLIFQNCRIFNEDNEFGKMGARLSEIFEHELLTIFKIQ